MTESLVAFVGAWGEMAIFFILAVNCFGVPFPASLLMLASGALVASGDMDLVPLLAFGVAGSVAGDQAGYLAGRLAGERIVSRFAGRPGVGPALAKAQDLARRWGAVGVFLSRWLLSPLGPYVNLAAGMTRLPWVLFTVAGVAGEAIWVGLYVGLGAAFSTSVQALADVLGNLTWFLVAGGITALLGWRIAVVMRRPRASPT